jgi:SAM-dependent methyltransferase
VRWPRARVVGIEVSAASIACTQELRRKHGLQNLELHRLPIERAAELGQEFDHVVCTGVLHHLADPDKGLRALRDVLAPGGAMHLMVYAPYGRAGVYMLQEYCRRVKIGWSDGEIRDLVSSLKALPAEHPLVPLLRNSPDFATPAGVADALLHPRDRSYSVPQLMEFVERTGLVFERWIRQAPYLPDCGAIATTPHAALLAKLPVRDQHAAMELFRGTMTRHAFICRRAGRPQPDAPSFAGNEWLEYVPLRLPDTIAVRERLPPGAVAVLINRNHTYTDLYMPIDAGQEHMWSAIDAVRTVGEIGATVADRAAAQIFFRNLWLWDQIIVDTSRCH